MKKAEMEMCRARYHALISEARRALQHGFYRKAVELALSSWDYIDGMMRYERRYKDREFTGLEGIDLVLNHAPLLLDFHSLDKLESLLKNQRRIERDTSENLGDKLAKARALMWDVHRMWDHLEQHGQTMEEDIHRILGGGEKRWRPIVDAWEKMGLCVRTLESGSHFHVEARLNLDTAVIEFKRLDGQLTLSTRMGEVVWGKCSFCGGRAEAPKAVFLEQSTCPHCGASVHFVILSRESTIAKKE